MDKIINDLLKQTVLDVFTDECYQTFNLKNTKILQYPSQNRNGRDIFCHSMMSTLY